MTMSSRIRILIADDHPVVLEGIASFIKTLPQYELIGKATNGSEVVELYQELCPDITVMDLKMPGLDGLQAIAHIRQINPQAKIIVLSSYDGEETIYQALQEGAMSYILKEILYEELVATLEAVTSGKKRLSAEIAAKLADRVARPSLSARELEVLELLVQGKSNTEIAQMLVLAEGTVKLHMHNILTKLKVSDRSAAISVAIKRGIVRL